MIIEPEDESLASIMTITDRIKYLNHESIGLICEEIEEAVRRAFKKSCLKCIKKLLIIAILLELWGDDGFELDSRKTGQHIFDRLFEINGLPSRNTDLLNQWFCCLWNRLVGDRMTEESMNTFPGTWTWSVWFEQPFPLI